MEGYISVKLDDRNEQTDLISETNDLENQLPHASENFKSSSTSTVSTTKVAVIISTTKSPLTEKAKGG